MTKEHWARIPDFPDYEVSDAGRVRQLRSGHMMKLLINQGGLVYVGLSRPPARQQNRSVARMVLNLFAQNHNPEVNTSHIHLNGDKTDCRLENLMFRPRWFAIEFHHQFERDYKPAVINPLHDVDTGEEFDNSRDVFTKYGLLDQDIFRSTFINSYNEDPQWDHTVWPTGQRFMLSRDRLTY